jgi:hypothetical protein
VRTIVATFKTISICISKCGKSLKTIGNNLIVRINGTRCAILRGARLFINKSSKFVFVRSENFPKKVISKCLVILSAMYVTVSKISSKHSMLKYFADNSEIPIDTK